MKKIIAGILAILVACTALTGCKNEKEINNSNSSTSSTPSTSSSTVNSTTSSSDSSSSTESVDNNSTSNDIVDISFEPQTIEVTDPVQIDNDRYFNIEMTIGNAYKAVICVEESNIKKNLCTIGIEPLELTELEDIQEKFEYADLNAFDFSNDDFIKTERGWVNKNVTAIFPIDDFEFVWWQMLVSSYSSNGQSFEEAIASARDHMMEVLGKDASLYEDLMGNGGFNYDSEDDGSNDDDENFEWRLDITEPISMETEYGTESIYVYRPFIVNDHDSIVIDVISFDENDVVIGVESSIEINGYGFDVDDVEFLVANVTPNYDYTSFTIESTESTGDYIIKARGLRSVFLGDITGATREEITQRVTSL